MKRHVGGSHGCCGGRGGLWRRQRCTRPTDRVPCGWDAAALDLHQHRAGMCVALTAALGRSVGSIRPPGRRQPTHPVLRGQTSPGAARNAAHHTHFLTITLPAQAARSALVNRHLPWGSRNRCASSLSVMMALAVIFPSHFGQSSVSIPHTRCRRAAQSTACWTGGFTPSPQ